MEEKDLAVEEKAGPSKMQLKVASLESKMSDLRAGYDKRLEEMRIRLSEVKERHLKLQEKIRSFKLVGASKSFLSRLKEKLFAKKKEMIFCYEGVEGAAYIRGEMCGKWKDFIVVKKAVSVSLDGGEFLPGHDYGLVFLPKERIIIIF